MACYNFNTSIISRGKGNSIAAAAAYQSGEKLRDIFDGRVHDRSYRQDVVFKEIILPPDAPSAFLDRQTWLNALNAAERRHNAQLARNIKVALPNELSHEDRVSLLQEFVYSNFIQHGLCADVAIHQGILDPNKKPDKIEAVQEHKDNPHAHILLPFRAVDHDGFQRTKTQTRFLNAVSYLMLWRESWANLQNAALERAGFDVRVTHESYAQRGIDREPTVHLGAATMALERKGIRTERGDNYREIIERNRNRETGETVPMAKIV